MSLTKSKLVSLYKKENDPKVKERLYCCCYQSSRRWTNSFSRCKRNAYRSNPWASDWLKRYDDKGIKGLQDRTKKAVDRLN